MPGPHLRLAMQTLKGAKALLRPYSMTITKKDGDYRVNFSGGKEESAYYTNDIDDAVATGIDMAQRKDYGV